jgi:general secretion pathway protein G
MKRAIISRNRRRGFTLMEIMVVVVVLGILAAVVLPNVMGQDDKARLAAAKTDIANFVTAVNMFKFDMKRFPYQEEGLSVLRTAPQGEDSNLWKGPYLQKAIPLDPWGSEYIYSTPAPDGSRFGIESYGADKMPGGTIAEFTKDINSWENYEDTDSGY